MYCLVPPAAMNNSVTKVDIIESNTGILTCPMQQGLPYSSIQWLKVYEFVLNFTKKKQATDKIGKNTT